MRPLLALCCLLPCHSFADGIAAEATPGIIADFDILAAEVTAHGPLSVFAMDLAGTAGATLPEPVGQLQGAPLHAYVWPTNINSAEVGFAPDLGILALVVTAHPDFDDTPAHDEDGDGVFDNDGQSWHSHWVVLQPEAACAGGLKVADLTPGAALPPSAPGLPLALDSPAARPALAAGALRLAMPLSDPSALAFDAVTASLTVNADGAVPLLCVMAVHDVASGDLSLPGRVD